jgi:hypothetical protein
MIIYISALNINNENTIINNQDEIIIIYNNKNGWLSKLVQTV